MKQRTTFFQILIAVALLHIGVLKFCWVGFAVPAPAPQASFVYADRVVMTDNLNLPLGRQEHSEIFIPAHQQEDVTPWRILNGSKKDISNVRVRL